METQFFNDNFTIYYLLTIIDKYIKRYLVSFT